MQQTATPQTASSALATKRWVPSNVADRRFMHATLLAGGSLLIDYRRGAPAVRSSSSIQLAWILAQRVLGCTAVVQSSSYLSSLTQRSYHRASDLLITRAEWGAAISLGLATSAVGATCVQHAGGRPLLCAGFLLMPSFYATLASRESLVLLRASQPRVYEAGLATAVGLLPLIFLPPSLRVLLGVPLALPPFCAAWLDECTESATTLGAREGMDDMRAAMLLYATASPGAAGAPPCDARDDCALPADHRDHMADTPHQQQVPDEPAGRVPQQADGVPMEDSTASLPTDKSPSSHTAPLRAMSNVAARAHSALSAGSSVPADVRTRITTHLRDSVGQLTERLVTIARATGWVMPAGCDYDANESPAGADDGRPQSFMAGTLRLNDSLTVEYSVPWRFSTGKSVSHLRTSSDPIAEQCWPVDDCASQREDVCVAMDVAAAEAHLADKADCGTLETRHALVGCCLRACLEHPPAHLDGSAVLPLWCAADALLMAISDQAVAALRAEGAMDSMITQRLGWLNAQSLRVEPPAWLRGAVDALRYGAGGLAEQLGDSRSFDTIVTERVPKSTAGLCVEGAPLVFAALLQPLQGQSYGHHRAALSYLHGLGAAIAPLLSARSAPAPIILSRESAAKGDIGVAMRWGLLPTVSAAADGSDDIVDGLEPIFIADHAAPYYRA